MTKFFKRPSKDCHYFFRINGLKAECLDQSNLEIIAEYQLEYNEGGFPKGLQMFYKDLNKALNEPEESEVSNV